MSEDTSVRDALLDAVARLAPGTMPVHAVMAYVVLDENGEERIGTTHSGVPIYAQLGLIECLRMDVEECWE